jgi:hypothetical protein
MKPMNQSDLHDIAAKLSGPQGTFGADNLVCYGMTTIVKPCAKTDEGAVVSGEAVQAMLGADYQVFPLAVEYKPDSFDQDLADLDDELEAMGDELEAPEEFGGAKGLRRRYLRVVARYRKCMTKQGIKEKRGRSRRCSRRFRKMQKRWQKMKRKGFSTQGLKSPRQVRAEFVTPSRRVARGPRRPQVVTRTRVVRQPVYIQQPAPMPMPMGPAPSTYVPTSQAVSPYYFADQAALEREAASFMPSYGAAQDELESDLRADATGYVFGGVEHDYWGIDGNIQLVLSEEDQEATEFGAVWSDSDFLDFDADEDLDDDILGDDDEDILGDDDEDILGDDDDDLLGEDDDDSDLLGDDDDDLLGEDDDDLGLDDEFGDAIEDKEEQIKAAGKLQSLMAQHDELVKKRQPTAHVDAQMESILLAAGARPEAKERILALVRERDDLVAQISGVFGDDEMGGVRHMVRRAKKQIARKGKIRPKLAKRMANKKAKLERRMSRARNPQRIQSRIAMIDEVLQTGSSNNGVDYGRVQPKTPGTPGKPVIVIAIRKRGGELSTERNKAVAEYGAEVGYHAPDAGLVDVFAADLYRVNQGHSPLEALHQHRMHVDPTTMVHGSLAETFSYEDGHDGELGYDELGMGPEDLAEVGYLGAEEELDDELYGGKRARRRATRKAAREAGASRKQARDIANRLVDGPRVTTTVTTLGFDDDLGAEEDLDDELGGRARRRRRHARKIQRDRGRQFRKEHGYKMRAPKWLRPKEHARRAAEYQEWRGEQDFGFDDDYGDEYDDYGADAPFPMGGAAPFPGPRRAGEEVY